MWEYNVECATPYRYAEEESYGRAFPHFLLAASLDKEAFRSMTPPFLPQLLGGKHHPEARPIQLTAGRSTAQSSWEWLTPSQKDWLEWASRTRSGNQSKNYLIFLEYKVDDISWGGGGVPASHGLLASSGATDKLWIFPLHPGSDSASWGAVQVLLLENF